LHSAERAYARSASKHSVPCRLQIGDTADCKSALRVGLVPHLGAIAALTGTAGEFEGEATALVRLALDENSPAVFADGTDEDGIVEAAFRDGDAPGCANPARPADWRNKSGSQRAE